MINSFLRSNTVVILQLQAKFAATQARKLVVWGGPAVLLGKEFNFPVNFLSVILILALVTRWLDDRSCSNSKF